MCTGAREGAGCLQEVCEGRDALFGAEDCWEGDLWGYFPESVSVWVVAGALAQDVFSSFSGFSARAVILTVEGKALPEFTSVSVSSATL